MSDKVTNDLLFEQLKAIQTKLGLMASDIADVKTDVRGVKAHMAAFLESEVAQDGAMAALQTRMERIERRLDLI